MRRTVRLNVKLFDSTNYRRTQHVFVMAIHQDGHRGVVEGVITSEYKKRVGFDDAFRKVFAVRVIRDVPASEVGIFGLADYKYGTAIK